MYPNGFDAPFAASIYNERYEHPEDVNWTGTTKRVMGTVGGALYAAPKAQQHTGYINDLIERNHDLMGYRKLCMGGRYLYGSGRDLHQVNNCLLMRCPDSREGWATTSYQVEMALMTGAGIGVWYGDLREAGAPIKRTEGVSAGPMPKMQQINETGRHVLAGGNRRGAIWAGLPWWHPDIFDFIGCKDWSDAVKALKASDWKFPAPMDSTNISVTLDDEFFALFKNDTARLTDVSWLDEHGFNAPDGFSWNTWAERVYYTACAHMLRHGEPGFTIDTGKNAGQVLRNACCEITSADDSDVCNLGSLVLSRFSSPGEFTDAVADAVMMLTAGSMYSDIPYEKVAEVRDKNRRLGLGLMGVHEFLMQRGIPYGTDDAFESLEPYMVGYARALEFANEQQAMLGISPSVAATAIAPTGTIGALMETTPGSDPMFSASEIRTVKTALPGSGQDEYVDHVVVDPTAARLVREGVSPDDIEDAYDLAVEPDRRLRQQAFLQPYVDHAISGTVNIPFVIEGQAEATDWADMLMGYLPELRGITVYPDGARAGQPRKPCDLAWALENEGTKFEANLETCAGGVCSA